MKIKVIIIMVVVVLVTAGVSLYNSMAKPDTQEAMIVGYMLQNPYSCEMPAIVIDAATCNSLFLRM